jgi:hypothetical protein
MADVALKRKAQRLKLNHPEAVAVISADHFEAQAILFECNAQAEADYQRVAGASLDDMATSRRAQTCSPPRTHARWCACS